MPGNYDESYELFTDFINKQLVSVRSKLKNAEYYGKIRKAYNEIKSGNYMRFIDNYALLSKINSNIKDNLDIIDFLVKNNITNAPQMDAAISTILNDSDLLRLAGNQESKEMLSGEEKQLTSIIDGTYDFETFKNALLNSGLSDEEIIAILTHEAEKSTKVEEKHQLPSLEEYNEEREEVKELKELLDKVNELTHKYYYLIEDKPNNLISMYRRTIKGANMLEVNNMFNEKDVLLCMHVLNLIDLKDEANELLNQRPIDIELVEVSIDELTSAYENASQIKEEFEQEQSESIPLDTSIFYLLENGNPMFNLDDFSEEEKKNISALLQDLEMGLFDYERSKSSHSRVLQTVKKSLNVFVNKKRNTSVSYVRINSKDLKDSKTLVLSIDDYRRIFDTTVSLLKTKGKLIDEVISKIKLSDEQLIQSNEEFKSSLSLNSHGEEVPSR